MVKSKKKRLSFSVVDEKALQKRRPGQAGRQEGDLKAREVLRGRRAPNCVWGHPGDGAGAVSRGQVELVT